MDKQRIDYYASQVNQLRPLLQQLEGLTQSLEWPEKITSRSSLHKLEVLLQAAKIDASQFEEETFKTTLNQLKGALVGLARHVDLESSMQ